MKYFICAGEASGDLHASNLINWLKKIDNKAEISFLGGDLMAQSAGCKPLIHYRQMAYMGFSEVIRHLPEVFGNLRYARKMIDTTRPDALILVDYPSFNLKLAAYANGKGIPVYYFISPKVWAWKEYRVKQIRRYVKRVFCILPFEVGFYRNRHNYEATYVGNPSAEEVTEQIKLFGSKTEFTKSISIDNDTKIIALVPGSRKGEIKNNLPVMLDAVKLAASRHGEKTTHIVTAAPGIDDDFYSQFISDDTILLRDRTLELMHFSDAALVTSGTATLECALAETPQVVCYRANGKKLSYKIMEKILKVPFVSLPNLIADSRIIPEMLVHQCTPELVSEQLLPLLSDTEQRMAQLDGYRRMALALGTNNCFETTARAIISDLK